MIPVHAWDSLWDCIRIEFKLLKCFNSKNWNWPNDAMFVSRWRKMIESSFKLIFDDNLPFSEYGNCFSVQCWCHREKQDSNLANISSCSLENVLKVSEEAAKFLLLVEASFMFKQSHTVHRTWSSQLAFFGQNHSFTYYQWIVLPLS